MADQLKSSIVSIRTANGAPVGVGLLLAERHILTCAQVVARSLGLASAPADPPQTEVRLDFPLLAPGRYLAAHVVFWQPPAPDGSGDIAGLKLDDELPAGARPTRLVTMSDLWGHPIRAFGFPPQTDRAKQLEDFAAYETGLRQLRERIGQHYDVLLYEQRLTENISRSRRHGDTETRRADRSEIIDSLNELAQSLLATSFNELCGLTTADQTPPQLSRDGAWLSGVLRGQTAPGQVQVEGEIAAHGWQGFSGAPVWDERLNGVVGMVVSPDARSGVATLYVIPAYELNRAWPIEERLYLTNLIAELEQRKGILAYVELAAQTDVPQESMPTLPERSIVDDWGLDGEFSLLEKTRPAPEQQRALSHPPEQTKRRLESILEAVREHSRFVLIGEPGAGKTTTIRRLARDAARARLEDSTAPLPLLLELPRWSNESTPLDFVRANWRLHDAPDQGLAAGNVLLFLDGLNEMGKEGPRKAKLLREWLHNADSPKRVIITCRAADYTGDLGLDLPTVLAEEMDEPRIRRFAAGYLEDAAALFLEKILPKSGGDRENARHLFRLARNPYLLTALMVVYKDAPDGALPRNTGVLFKGLVQVLWERERERQIPGWVPLEEMEAAFSRLAFAMIDQRKPIDMPYQWTLSRLAEQHWWQRMDGSKKIAALLNIGRSANLVEMRGNNVRFYHQW